MHTMILTPSSSTRTTQSEPLKGYSKRQYLWDFLKGRSCRPQLFHYNQQKVNPQGIFGAPLECAAQCGILTPQGLRVPAPVYLCFTEIIKRGLKVEGLFRLSGAASEVASLERRFDFPGTHSKSIDLSKHDIHTITSIVKKYLRQLPVPVIPPLFHDKFLAVTDYKDEKAAVKILAELITELPQAHHHLLFYILILASEMQTYSDLNMMNPEALAVVLAPVCTGLEQTLKELPLSKKKRRQSPSKEDMELLIERNTQWTHLWRIMISEHQLILNILYQQRQKSHYTVTLPSRTPSPPAVVTPSPPPPFHIFMSQFCSETIAVAPPLKESIRAKRRELDDVNRRTHHRMIRRLASVSSLRSSLN
ncbi:Rho GTPase activation protein [Radiomyces spectabilis]|uniref:Rho GTPase activation protein n=1 Tax=Radiomyces spectabilis TaxID=64574 RepID=UPI002220D014|nr:Rho GTPase activation protein [Radiomyces spectabilis]KAI8391553.1 Rho GTPase activation protein [Radiomyces spectabilis]